MSVSLKQSLPVNWRVLDEQISQARALGADVADNEQRLRNLLHVTQFVIGDLQLSVVLERVIRVAVEMTQAGAGVLCVAGTEDDVHQYVRYQVESDDQAEQLVRGIESQGLLCAPAVETPRTMLTDVPGLSASVASTYFGSDSRLASGVPALGVFIRVRNEFYARLFVEAAEGSRGFFLRDEELLLALADTAGVAIDNALLFEESRARQLWSQASAEITSELLRAVDPNPLDTIVRSALVVGQADAVVISLPDAKGEVLRTAASLDSQGLSVLGRPVRVDRSTLGLVLSHSRPIRITDLDQLIYQDDSDVFGESYRQIMMLPLIDASGTRGVLSLCRRSAQHRFTDVDLQMALTFSTHAALAMELSGARQDLERVLLLEERDRIAHDLHDHVIARLFATGLVLERIASDLGPGGESTRLLARVGEIDDTIREIRSSVFHLRNVPDTSAIQGSGVVQGLLLIVAEAEEPLGFAPSLRFRGSPDSTEPAIADDLAAVLREALANVVRHAQARHVEIEVSNDGEFVSLMVRDDGVGLNERNRSSGLENMRQRALRRVGQFSASSDESGGTTVLWRVPSRPSEAQEL